MAHVTPDPHREWSTPPVKFTLSDDGPTLTLSLELETDIMASALFNVLGDADAIDLAEHLLEIARTRAEGQ